MKKYTLILLAIPLMALECENRKFTEVAAINYEKVYVIDKTAPFDEKATITRNEVLDMFDIPNDAEIKDVNIESITARVVVVEGNQATSLLLSGYLQLGSTNPAIFNSYPAVLKAVDAPFIGLNPLIAGGVSGLKNKLKAYLMGSDTEPFDMHVSGDSAPSGGQLVNVIIYLKINGSVEWESCEETLWFIEGGDPC